MAHRRREVAVLCWFPTGDKNPIPISFKLLDDCGEIQHIKDLHIKHTNTIMQGKEFICNASVNGKNLDFTLTFFSESCRWFINS